MFFPDYDALVGLGLSPADIRTRIADAGLALTDFESISHWLPGQAPPAGMNDWLAGRLMLATPELVCPIAASVGARTVSLIEMFGMAAPPEVMAASLARVCAVAADHGLDVALEFVPTGGIPDLATAWDAVRMAGAPNARLVIDSWHFFRSGSSLDLLASLPAAAIGCIQLNDGPAMAEADLGHAMMHDRLLPGAGDFDLAGLMAAIRATGATTPISIEVFSDALNELPVDAAITACADALRGLHHD